MSTLCDLTRCLGSASFCPVSKCLRQNEQVSAVTREGFDDLLETLLLQAEILDLRADNKVMQQILVGRTRLEIAVFWS